MTIGGALMADNKHPPKPELSDEIISGAILQLRRVGMCSYAVQFYSKCTKNHEAKDRLLEKSSNEVMCDCLQTDGLMSETRRKWYPYSDVFESLRINSLQTENAATPECRSDHQNCSGEH